jgi:hypothetical protein
VTLDLIKFETLNTTFRLNSSVTYITDDMRILISKFVSVNTANAMLEYTDDVFVFVTTKYNGQHVIVYVTVLDLWVVLFRTHSMPLSCLLS